jgi:predicted ABC-type ATPase
LPEYTTYVDQVPHLVDRLTKKEAGYVAETLVWAALQEGRSVVLDSSLKDASWYVRLIDRVRSDHAHYKVALIQVSCPSVSLIHERAKLQARETGREVPFRVLEDQIEHTPKSVDVVSPVVDQYYVLRNDADEIRVVGGCSSWEEFSDAFHPRHEGSGEHAPEHGPSSPCSSSSKRRSLRRISILRSSEENHRSDDMNFYGKFAHLRKTLDYTVGTGSVREIVPSNPLRLSSRSGIVVAPRPVSLQLHV